MKKVVNNVLNHKTVPEMDELKVASEKEKWVQIKVFFGTNMFFIPQQKFSIFLPKIIFFIKKFIFSGFFFLKIAVFKPKPFRIRNF